jgi:hypothetical protein
MRRVATSPPSFVRIAHSAILAAALNESATNRT